MEETGYKVILKNKQTEETSCKKKPAVWLSVAPIAVLVGLLAAVVNLFGSDTLEGASQIALLTATAVCILPAMIICRVSWKEIERAIVHNITGVATALLILLLIGALSGIWMVSGVIPTLVYYGMKVMSADFYLASTCVICAVVSVMTGSSWTTIATIGIALSGVGMAQGFSPGWIAGAIISGAYFGDKISPLSDTTILASAVTETPLFVHIRYMMITTVPSITIALTVYTLAGFSHHAASSEEVNGFSEALVKSFNINPLLLTVPAVMLLLIVKRVPSLICLFASCFTACIFALVFQPHLLGGISGDGGLTGQFKGMIMSVYGRTAVETGSAALNDLVSTRGMAGMMNTIWLIICAMCFGGAMTASGMLGSIIATFLRFMRNTVGVVASTAVSGLLLNITTSDQYISIILTGDMYKDIYSAKGYERRLLSRTTEDSVTVTSPLVPWNTCGMTQSTVLGISTLTYLPYCFFNLISPLMSIIVAMTGFRIIKTPPPAPQEGGESKNMSPISQNPSPKITETLPPLGGAGGTVTNPISNS
ncbi:MAG: sodium:proton antiporter [Tannerella sp.]|jgi:NhaC family Na+:H+ antiporter|nr:sodium:proton antiporter [Tannerella sp.]